MSPDAIQVAVAGGVTLVTSILALRAGSPGAAAVEETDTVAPASGAAPAAPPTPPPTAGPAARPRILTGEPAAAEQRKPAPRRAMKLLAGIAVLAVAGAFGLLAFVRALISMFDRIGG